MVTAQPFFALHGPPGTGKTTVVAHAVAAYLAADPASRVLISAQSNDALDHITTRVLEQVVKDGVPYLPIRIATDRAAGELPPAMKALQLGAITEELAKRLRDHAKRKMKEVGDPKLVPILADWKRALDRGLPELQARVRAGANLVFATCEGATTATLGHHSSLPAFDWVIVEEAAKAWPTELAIPLVRGTRWTLVGDHRQLPAHRREEVDAFLSRSANSKRRTLAPLKERLESVRSAFDLFKGVFDSDDESAPVEMLTCQFRMRRPIAEVVSRAFYGGRLKTDDDAEVRRHGITTPGFLRDQPLVWLNTGGWEDEDEPYWRNSGEAQLVARLVARMRPELDGATDWDSAPLAVLTPYHAQRRLLDGLGVGDVHTIHSFQGNEAEVVVVSLVRTTPRGNARRSIGHLSKPEVANVLLSRARRLLVLVGRFDHFRDSGVRHWQDICAAVEEVGQIVSWRDSELVKQ